MPRCRICKDHVSEDDLYRVCGKCHDVDYFKCICGCGKIFSRNYLTKYGVTPYDKIKCGNGRLICNTCGYTRLEYYESGRLYVRHFSKCWRCHLEANPKKSIDKTQKQIDAALNEINGITYRWETKDAYLRELAAELKKLDIIDDMKQWNIIGQKITNARKERLRIEHYYKDAVKAHKKLELNIGFLRGDFRRWIQPVKVYVSAREFLLAGLRNRGKGHFAHMPLNIQKLIAQYILNSHFV